MTTALMASDSSQQRPHPPSHDDAPIAGFDEQKRLDAMAQLDARRRALASARAARRRDNLLRGGLIGAVLTMLPLFHFTYGQDQFTFPKIAMATVLLSIALFWWAWGIVWRGRGLRLNIQPITWALLAWWGVHVVGVLVAVARSGSSFHLAWERLVWISALSLMVLLLQDFARGRRKLLLAIGWLLILSAAVSAVWVLWEDFGRWIGSERTSRVVSRLPDWRGYLSAGLGNTGFVADWIAMSFPVAVMLLMRVRGRVLPALLMAHLTLGAAAMTVCWSVHSNGGLIVGAAFMMWWMIRRRRGLLWRARRRLATQAALWVAVVLFYVLPHPVNPHGPGIVQQAFGSERWEEGGSTRLVIWGGTFSMIATRPITGWGTGNFTYGYPQTPNKFIGPESPLARYVGQWTNAAHNVVLQAWAELGILGLLALVAVAAVWWRSVRRPLGRGNPFNDDVRLVSATMGLVALIHGMMNFLLQIPSSAALLFGLATVPLLLVDRNKSLRENRMEFEFDRGWYRLTLRGEGMLSLRGLGLALALPKWLRAVTLVVIATITGSIAWSSVSHLIADVHYNAGYQVVQRPYLLSPENATPERAFAAFERALSWDPRHADALSDRAKLNYLLGEWEGVLADTEAAMRGLRAQKLVYWRAEALVRLGRQDEALPLLATARALQSPQLAQQYGAPALASSELQAILQAPPGTRYANM